MGIYKTYKEAVLANGGTKGVYNNLITGWFHLDTSNPGSWVECNPADYLETLESFLVSGKRFVEGDSYIEKIGSVVSVVSDDADIYYRGTAPQSAANEPMKGDDKRFILQSAADQVETLEEKEAFDSIPNQTTLNAMSSEAEKESYNSALEAFDAIDTTSQQVEPLGKAEWKNGDALSYWCFVRKDWFDGVYVALDKGMHVVRDLANDEYKGVTLKRMRKPETPEERKERERDEMAKQLMIDMCGENVFAHRDWEWHKNHTYTAEQAFAIIDKGYRKERKQ